MSYAAIVAAKQFYNGAVQNTNAPVFSGISTLVANSDGSFTAGWSVATGSAQNPIRYQVYIALGTVSAAALFVSGNIVYSVPGTSVLITTLSNQTYLTKGQDYTVGVRAISANNISETNTAVLTETMTGMNLSSVAGAVWDELKSAHNVSGSFGENLDAKSSDIKKLTAAGL